MPEITTRLVCSGCGAVPSEDDPLPFRCPNAREGDDTDHVLRREIVVVSSPDAWRRVFLDDTPNPFVRYRTLFHSYRVARVARTRGLTDLEFVGMVESLDASVQSVCGVGFRETPFLRHDALNRALGRKGGALWVKDETGNVSGSHKARHMMGLLVWLEMVHRTGMMRGDASRARLAIASCGNAALAAAVVARAAHRQLEVFIPPDAHPNVTRQLTDLGAHLTICERQGSATGDPCVARFRESLVHGALPFTVQGNENGLAIEGGLTLSYEIVSALLRDGSPIDRIFVQTGGGALVSSCVQALHDAKLLGLIETLPKIHAVQTEGAHPLRRAWEELARMILGETRFDSASDAARAEAIAAPKMESKRREALRFAATHRSRFMWPWEAVPHSVAHGILDDETYDWFAIVEGMLETGGWPVVVSEAELREANDLSAATTDIPADHTGTSGLAGCLQLVREGVVDSSESIAVLLTGRRR